MDTYLGEFEHLVLLGILRLGDEAYAVPVRQEIETHTGRSVARGALYTTLDRLEAKGLVRSRLGDPDATRGGRPRRYFTVTPLGMSAVRGARAAIDRLSKGLDWTLADPRP
jgi:PadR family transcriptional regulator PadR